MQKARLYDLRGNGLGEVEYISTTTVSGTRFGTLYGIDREVLAPHKNLTLEQEGGAKVEILITDLTGATFRITTRH